MRDPYYYRPFSLPWKIGMVVALFLIMGFVVKPAAKFIAVNYGIVGGVITCGLLLAVSMIIHHRETGRWWH